MPIDNYGEIEITYTMLADKSKRFVNNLVDSIVCYALTFGIGLIGNQLYNNYGFTGLAVGNIEQNTLKFNLLHLAVSIVFYGLFETLTARTPGKYITATKVIMRDGTKPDQGTIFLRTICRLIPFEAISFLGRYTIGWHDGLSKTLVVDIYEYEKALRNKNSDIVKDTDYNNE
jgi:uncharacterized RDD family membrane protein YckC